MKSVLIIGDVNHPLIYQLYKRIHEKKDIDIDILSFEKSYYRNTKYFRNLYLIPSMGQDRNFFKRKFEQMAYLLTLKNVIKNLPKYDSIHIHYYNPIYRYIISILRRKTDNLIITIWGSDYYRVSKKQLNMNSNAFNLADKITFTNEKTLDDFIKNFNISLNRLKITRFGLETLDYIDKIENSSEMQSKISFFKKKYHIPEKLKVITCGYNSSPGQQHELILNAINKLPQDYAEKCVFLFPLAYGDNVHKEKIKEIIRNIGRNILVLEAFMVEEELAILRLISDIMINIQVTDQLSGSMQETLYAGNIVINGSWLPYDIFHKNNVFFLNVDNPIHLDKLICSSIEKYDDLKNMVRNNKSYIRSLSGWDENLEDWYNLYLGNKDDNDGETID
ncbi:glycosyltransferase [Vaginisenegalia massiliensis]|uniref:glycosyltransferase n=1 Tax=Vaginisenegalia massiliensis TaxID=2058294 RepID=UPI000F5202D5|nr:glycosyltransferase [Vaginisenegalia massiliensis]